jgi:hypothetical protein
MADAGEAEPPALAIRERRSSSQRPACRGVPPALRHTPHVERLLTAKHLPRQSAASVHAGERIKRVRKQEEGWTGGWEALVHVVW